MSKLRPPVGPDDHALGSANARVTLVEYGFRGKPVVLAFYPADWSPVCGDQMALYNEMRGEFARYGAQVLGLSVDGVWCHAAFAADRKLHFPLLASFARR